MEKTYFLTSTQKQSVDVCIEMSNIYFNINKYNQNGNIKLLNISVILTQNIFYTSSRKLNTNM